LEVLDPGVSLPPLEPSQVEGFEVEEPEGHGGETEISGTRQPEQLGDLTYEFKGIVESMSGSLWTINGQQLNVEFAENSSPVSVGVLVEFEGYYSIDGQFIVTKIEVKSSGLFKGDPVNSSGKGSGGSDGNNDSSGSDSGGDVSNSNESEDDHNEEDNEGDH
jgi:hypothetical protein